jgi:NADH-quinone oxidoreductase subunit E
VRPSRGASSVCSFKQMSRVLAGFSDGRADEGPGAGEASLVGLRLAAERGWSAPAAGGDEQPEARTDGTAQSEHVAAEHVANPAAPSSSDAAVAPGEGGAAPAGDHDATPKNEQLTLGDSDHDTKDSEA